MQVFSVFNNQTNENLTIIIALLLIVSGAMAQTKQPCSTCLPEGITFETQTEIDSFSVNYLHCNTIEGSVQIGGDIPSYNITNLYGLNPLRYIEGNLYFYANLSLKSLSGLDNLEYVGGNLEFFANDSLPNLTGLGNLTEIGGKLEFYYNDFLYSLTGLNNLASIGGDLNVTYTQALVNFYGLNNLTYIGGDLDITGNVSLTSLEGLENIDPASIDTLVIFFNEVLKTCNIESICDYLAAPGGNVRIRFNGPGCNSIIDLGMACGDPLPCLPYGDYLLNNQSDIGNFGIVFPDCSDLDGDMEISGDSIINLNGLIDVNAVEGNLYISSNYLLSSLAGLNNLASVGNLLFIYIDYSLSNLEGLEGLTTVGSLYIFGNDELNDLSGLEGLKTIGGELQIGFNASLSNIQGLESLTSIDSTLFIADNGILQSLSGLDNISAGSITDLKIWGNNLLSTCNVQSICEYLAASNGTILIVGNAPGCNSEEEVQTACEMGFGELDNWAVGHKDFSQSLYQSDHSCIKFHNSVEELMPDHLQYRRSENIITPINGITNTAGHI